MALALAAGPIPGVWAAIFAIAGAAVMQAPVAWIASAIELTNTISAPLVPALITVAGAVILGRGPDPRSIHPARSPTSRPRRSRTAAGPRLCATAVSVL
jgi:H+/Cl- antiporter ClcA